MQRRRKFIPMIFFCLLASIIIVIIFRNKTQNFIANSVTSVFTPFQKNIIALFFQVSNVNSNVTIKRLREENIILSKKIIDQTKIEKENSALKDQFRTTSISTQHLLPAHIIGIPGFIPGSDYPDTFVIDQGIRDGVKAGMPVIYKDMLIGLVSSVTNTNASITVVTSKSSSFTAITLDKRVLGVIKGQGNGEMVFDNALLSQQIVRDDIVITNGDMHLDGTGYPSGLLVGKITSIEKDPSALFQKANVSPLINLYQLSMVFVKVEK